MQLNLKPSHAKVREYYNALNQYGQLNISHETAVREAFASLLDSCARQFQWKLVHEFRVPAPRNKYVTVDGAVLDSFTLKHGYWEAKDLEDNLEKEIKKKLDLGYPRNNIIFQSPERAILYQNGVRQGLNEDITSAENLIELLKVFFSYREPQHEEWEAAVADFSSRIPEIAGAVKTIIEKERRANRKFIASFEAFVELCRQAINPNLSEDAVETMLIQHLLTERIFRKVFNNPEFTRRNIIAAEIEKVIDSLTSKHFSRDAFLQDLDRFYRAIEINAENATDYAEKQSFLNTVYERFFQGFSPKQADTHGIVYTPQSIVNFMVRSVEEILQKEFGKSLSHKDVHILDPFVGTGNFIVRVMQEIRKTALPYKYANELHCNEVMLLPYYIASMNIEHAYLEATGEYKSFEGICMVDTFELAEEKQIQMFTAKNTERVLKQKESPIFVVIGNPPYNAWQISENDNNKNRKYPILDKRVSDLYAAGSAATLLSSLSDPYIKAFRWASDRIGDEGIIAFVSNSSFIDQIAFDQLRKRIPVEFDEIYLVDLGGNVRKNPKLSGTTHNVFGIQVGVSINLLVRHRTDAPRKGRIHYFAVELNARREEKYRFLEKSDNLKNVNWRELNSDSAGNWLTQGLRTEWKEFLLIGAKQSRIAQESGTIFNLFSHGINTQRDSVVYNFSSEHLTNTARLFSRHYNSEIDRWIRAGRPQSVDSFVDYTKVKWSRNLKRNLRNTLHEEFTTDRIRVSLYRPFSMQYLYLSEVLVDETGRTNEIFPTSDSQQISISVSAVGSEKPFLTLASNALPNYHLTGAGSGTQFFPACIYSEDGSNRRDNITDWALDQFRSHYKDKAITKSDIFYYVYAVLHHPQYRTRYAANLKRELPRIPFAPDFRAFAKAGKRLAELHVDYEKQKEYELERTEKPGQKLNFRVEKMRLNKDKQTLVYNDFLSLSGIPKETYEYRLGNRSALEWVIDQYQVTTDTRSGITNDPNRDDDPEYILRLIGQVITVSLETVKIVNSLPSLGLPTEQKENASTTNA